MTLDQKQIQLLEYFKAAHGDQRRKYSDEPYWKHCYSVAERASRYVQSPGTIEIALCHDLLEDTACDRQELAGQLAELGYPAALADLIVDGVIELTDVYIKDDYPDLNRQERKHRETIRLHGISPLAQSVKYADLTDNALSITRGDAGFARVYLKEKLQVLNQIREGDIHLLIECCATFKTCIEELNMKLHDFKV